MLGFVVSIASAIMVTFAVGLPLGSVLYGIVPGIIVFFVVWFLIGRKIMRDLQQRMESVQKILTPKNPMRPTKPRFDDAIKVLEGGRVWAKWSPFVKGQIDGQIGVMLYLDQRFDEALPYLQSASARNWVAKAMQGAIHFRKKQPEPMKAAFESAVKYSPKESLLWNVYAWCLYKRQDRDAAIDVLNRGLAKVGNDERTSRNLQAIRNSKGMKMKGWNEMWYQFHLEKPPQVAALPQQHVSKRAMYRGR
jgi:tetratricopeptide (TPR) repeat protein